MEPLCGSGTDYCDCGHPIKPSLAGVTTADQVTSLPHLTWSVDIELTADLVS